MINPCQPSYTATMNAKPTDQSGQEMLYRIRFRGAIDPPRQEWFHSLGFHLIQTELEEHTTVEGAIKDQAQLRSVLTRLWDLNLEITLVQRLDKRPDQGG